MKQVTLKMFASLLLTIGITGVYAQQSATTTGGQASGSGGTASYAVGQIVYTTNTGTNGSVAQGVQQPFEISVVSGIEQAKGIKLECIVYPNPVTDYLQLKVDADIVKTHGRASQVLSYQLFDTDGKMIRTEKIITAETKINTENIVQGNYLLRIIENDKEIKTFKIIKE